MCREEDAILRKVSFQENGKVRNDRNIEVRKE